MTELSHRKQVQCAVVCLRLLCKNCQGISTQCEEVTNLHPMLPCAAKKHPFSVKLTVCLAVYSCRAEKKRPEGKMVVELTCFNLLVQLIQKTSCTQGFLSDQKVEGCGSGQQWLPSAGTGHPRAGEGPQEHTGRQTRVEEVCVSSAQYLEMLISYIFIADT